MSAGDPLDGLDDESRDHLERDTQEHIERWRGATSLDHLVAYDEFDGRVTASGITAPPRIATVSDDFWELAGVRPALGHLPTTGQSEVLLSHAFFERWLGASPDVLAKTIAVSGRSAS